MKHTEYTTTQGGKIGHQAVSNRENFRDNFHLQYCEIPDYKSLGFHNTLHHRITEPPIKLLKMKHNFGKIYLKFKFKMY